MLTTDEKLARERRQVLLVLGVAAALRVLASAGMLIAMGPRWLFTRGEEMAWLARSVVQGHGLASPFGVETGPTAMIAPGYPLLVAVVFRACGVMSPASAVMIVGLQVLLNVAAVYLVMRLARALFHAESALAAGWLWACSLPLCWVPTILWDTSFTVCALAGFACLLVEHRYGMPRRGWALLGALAAVAALVNPALLLSILAMQFAYAWRTRRTSRPRPWLALAVFAAVFAAWPVRNAVVFHAFVPLRSTVGYELWMGNHPGADGYLQQAWFPSFNAAELARYEALGELHFVAEKQAVARAWIAAHPEQFAALTMRRVARFWTGTGTSGGSLWFVLHACTTFVMGISGLCALWRSRRGRTAAWLLVWPMLLFPLPYYVTHAEFRYRLALDPLLTALSGPLLWHVLLRLRVKSERRKRLAVQVVGAD